MDLILSPKANTYVNPPPSWEHTVNHSWFCHITAMQAWTAILQILMQY